MTRRVSLTQYLIEQQRQHGHITAELRLLIEVVARACKRISIAVNKGLLGDVMGSAVRLRRAVELDLGEIRDARHQSSKPLLG